MFVFIEKVLYLVCKFHVLEFQVIVIRHNCCIGPLMSSEIVHANTHSRFSHVLAWQAYYLGLPSIGIAGFLSVCLSKRTVLEPFPPSCHFLSELSVDLRNGNLLVPQAQEFFLVLLYFFLKLYIFLPQLFVRCDDVFAVRLQLSSALLNLFLEKMVSAL